MTNSRTHNSTLAIGGVSCSADPAHEGLRMNIHAKNTAFGKLQTVISNLQTQLKPSFFSFLLLLVYSCEPTASSQKNSLDYMTYVNDTRDYEKIVSDLMSFNNLKMVNRVNKGEYQEEIWFADAKTYQPIDTSSHFWIYVNRFSKDHWNIDIHYTKFNKEIYEENVRKIKKELKYMGKEFDERCQCQIKTYLFRNEIYVEYLEKLGVLDSEEAFHITVFYEEKKI